MISILYICLHCTYIHPNSERVDIVHTVFTLKVDFLISSTSFVLFLFPQLPPFLLSSFFVPPPALMLLTVSLTPSGPEPPTDIVFSEVTENSLTVSWTKPKSPVSGFKVTYTHSEDGETPASWCSFILLFLYSRFLYLPDAMKVRSINLKLPVTILFVVEA